MNDLERIAQARQDYYEAQRQLRKSVIKARQRGHSLRRIAEMAGVSNVTVLNWSRNGNSK